ncbi:MAG: DUF3822 family protein [Bacteroidota bacterium]
MEGIISNSVSQDIKNKGHLSIRFAPDRFSILVSDASYRPVLLKEYRSDASVPASKLPVECSRILDELQLLSFEGETVFIMDTSAVSLVPDQFFSEETARSLLDKTIPLEETDRVDHRHIRDRHLHILFAYPAELDQLKAQIKGKVNIIHTAECMISLSDQIQASDHQRGFFLADVQLQTLDLLVIREDGIRLQNRYALKEPSDFIYHTLNTMKQLEMDRENVPVYLTGTVHPEHELFTLLGKYVRHVKATPYYLEELSTIQVLRFMILSEGSKCA